MTDDLAKTGERVMPDSFSSVEEYLCYLRHRYAYEYVGELFPSGGSWLEIGSGEGYGSAMLARRADKLIGLDLDAPTVAHAMRKYGSHKCTFMSYDGITLPYENGAFDVVVSFQVIEHIEDDREFLAEAARVLKKGGQLALTTPNRTYRLQPGQKPWNKYHVREYYPDDLRALLENQFSDVTVWGIMGKGQVQEIELAAVKKGFYDLDRFNLRHLIPAGAKPTLARMARFLSGRRLDTEGVEKARNQYSSSDYIVIKDSLEASLDLLAICQKEKQS